VGFIRIKLPPRVLHGVKIANYHFSLPSPPPHPHILDGDFLGIMGKK
jgi:hypothetical protein